MTQMPGFTGVRRFLRRFAACEQGTASLEFVMVFPIFFGFFLMTYESGMVNAQHVMLERGVDIAVRDVRIGRIATPTPDRLRRRICEVARIIPDCVNQLQLEMVTRDPRAWAAVSRRVECVDRSIPVQPVMAFSNGGNNDMMILKVCVRIDPLLPTTGLGRAIVTSNSNDRSGGSLALVAYSAFVIEPFKSEE